MKNVNMSCISALLVLGATACAPVAVVAHPIVPARGATLTQLSAGLDGYGEWVVVADYGRVWRPGSVASNWTPYTHGSWLWVNDAWVWRSDYRWGQVAFNYGQWHQDPGYGWVWVPSTRPAPARGVWRADLRGPSPLRHHRRHQEHVARVQPARPAPARAQPARSQPARAQPARVQPARAKPSKAQPAKARPAKSKGQGRGERGRARPAD